MRCRWCSECSSRNQLLGFTLTVLDSNLDRNSSKAGMMEGIVFVMLRPAAKRFDWGHYLRNLDQHFLLDQCQGVLLPEQERIKDTIHVNLVRVNLRLWALFIPRGEITELGAVCTLHQLLNFLVGSRSSFFPTRLVSCGSHP
jgi:hypothetical protein